MPLELNDDAFRKMILEDMQWLDRIGHQHSLERLHIVDVLKWLYRTAGKLPMRGDTPEIERSIRAAYLRGFGEAKGLALVVCDESHDMSIDQHPTRTEEYIAEVRTAQWIATRIDELKPQEAT